jgi:hypothetical protein
VAKQVGDLRHQAQQSTQQARSATTRASGADTDSDVKRRLMKQQRTGTPPRAGWEKGAKKVRLGPTKSAREHDAFVRKFYGPGGKQPQHYSTYTR